MQKIYLFITGIIIWASAIAQPHEFTIGYGGSMPQGLMKNGWSSAHGITAGYSIVLPSLPALSFGVNLDWGLYASKRRPQQYQFTDGSITNTHVSLSSSIATFAGKMRYTHLQTHKISPFFEMQAGHASMFSSFYIEDPVDGCRALENETVSSSGTFFGGILLGSRWNLGADEKGNRHALELSVGSVRGGTMDYANMNRVYHDHNEINGTRGAQRGNGESPLLVTFLNISNNTTHQHSIAEVYTHPLRMFQFHLSYVYTLKK